MPQGYPPPEGSPVNVTSTSVEPAAGAKANATWLVLPRLPTIDAPPDSLSGEWCRLRGAGHTTNSLAFGYPRGEGSQPLGSDVEHLGLLWEPLPCAGSLRCWIKRRAWAHSSRERVTEDFPYVSAFFELVFPLGSSSICQCSPARQDSDSPPSLKAASPADFA